MPKYQNLILALDASAGAAPFAFDYAIPVPKEAALNFMGLNWRFTLSFSFFSSSFFCSQPSRFVCATIALSYIFARFLWNLGTRPSRITSRFSPAACTIGFASSSPAPASTKNGSSPSSSSLSLPASLSPDVLFFLFLLFQGYSFISS